MQILVDIGPSNSSQGQHRRKDATEQMKNEKNLGSSPSECQIFHFFSCVFSSVLPMRSVGRKKMCLYHNDLNNYRPVSKPCFIAKILEKLVLSQVSSYLNSRNLHNTCQSVYRQGHSTETALLSAVNDLFLSLNKGNISVLALLAFSSALTSWIILSMNTIQYWLWIHWCCPSMVFILSEWS